MGYNPNGKVVGKAIRECISKKMAASQNNTMSKDLLFCLEYGILRMIREREDEERKGQCPTF